MACKRENKKDDLQDRDTKGMERKKNKGNGTRKEKRKRRNKIKRVIK